MRRPELAGHLQPLGSVGQIHAVQANLRYPRSVEAAVRDSAIVINLVGILFERGRQRFDAVQAYRRRAGRARGLRLRRAHDSCLGHRRRREFALALRPIEGEGREGGAGGGARRHDLPPSIVFGPEDDFFNRFASLARFLPALPLIGGGLTRFQPVFVGDVAEAIAQRGGRTGAHRHDL